jgi:hypothetical protein
VPLILGLALVKLLIDLYSGHQYGYFRDELYYLACSRHLAWGYVDQPPLIALIAGAVRSSLFAMRLLSALAGAMEVVFTALIAREFGGKRFAQALAALALITAPGIMVMDHFLSMNAFEPLFWLGCALLLIRILKTGNPKLWLWFGVLAGFGLENKYSMLIFGAGIVVGLVLTPARRTLRSPYPYLGALIAFLIFLPNLIWNVQHHFPFLELQANIKRNGRDVALSPSSFFGQEVLMMNPVCLPLWLGGLWFFFSRAGKPWRVLGWTFAFAAVVIMTMSPRVYYLFPAFPLLFAGGAVFWESRARWMRVALPVLLVVSAAVIAPIAIPVLSPQAYLTWTKTLHMAQPAIENHEMGPLPQIMADQFGWPEMAASVAQVYNKLPADVRAKTAIFGQNYGEAGAIDQFGPQYGLPPAISGHQNYFFWGPRGYTGESVIVMNGSERDLARRFSHVEKVGHVYHEYSMPYEHFDIFYCTGPVESLQALWPQVKSWD